MLNYKKGNTIAMIDGGKGDGKILFVNPKIIKRDEEEIVLKNGKFLPIPPAKGRSVVYIAAPSGAGKTTFAAEYIKAYLAIFPEKDFFIFSRTDAKDDKAFRGMKYSQVKIDKSLIEDPIDITKELTNGCIILFDDVNTILDDKIKKEVDKLMADIMEVGRKLNISIVITNHLVIPNEKKIARTILNECQSLTVFPKSGSVQQIRYCLKNYFGYDDKQIKEFLKEDTRWIMFFKSYPQIVLTERKCFIP